MKITTQFSPNLFFFVGKLKALLSEYRTFSTTHFLFRFHHFDNRIFQNLKKQILRNFEAKISKLGFGLRTMMTQ
jgi:hypothetical protein